MLFALDESLLGLGLRGQMIERQRVLQNGAVEMKRKGKAGVGGIGELEIEEMAYEKFVYWMFQIWRSLDEK